MLHDALQSFTELSEAAIVTLVRCWARVDEMAAANAKHVFNIGQLVSLDWKLGVSISSSQCQNLMTPFVTLTFRVVDANGSVTTQEIELTYSEFQVLHGRMHRPPSRTPLLLEFCAAYPLRALPWCALQEMAKTFTDVAAVLETL